MDFINYILFICMVIPLGMLLFLLDKKARYAVGLMIAGMFMCLFVGEINGLLLNVFNNDMYYVTTTITPITEEIVKAIPVLLFAIVVCDDIEEVISISIAVGIGFAMLENISVIVNNLQSVDIMWTIARGFGSGLMHGVTTATVGIGFAFIKKRKKLFFVGTFALLSVAIIYHATFNVLIQSSYKYVGILLPILTYIPLVLFRKKIISHNKRLKK